MSQYEKRREYFREYYKENRKKYRQEDYAAKKRRAAGKKQILVDRLGGECVGCGTTHNLEFDHIDRSKKSFTLGRNLQSLSLEKLIVEADKCRLLCTQCHRVKTRVNADNNAILKGYELAKVEHIDNKIIITYETNTNQD